MPLSDYEKHLLDDIERSLSSEDPRLEHSLRRARSGGLPRLSSLAGVVGVLVGIGLLLLGVAANAALGVVGVVVAVVGYVIVVLSVNICINAFRTVSR